MLFSCLLLTSCFESKSQTDEIDGGAAGRVTGNEQREIAAMNKPPDQVVKEAMSGVYKLSGWMLTCKHWLDDLVSEKYAEARMRLSPELQQLVNVKFTLLPALSTGNSWAFVRNS